MKLYLTLLSIFLGSFAISGLAIAEISTKEVTETESIAEISQQSAPQTSESFTEGEIKDGEPDSSDTYIINIDETVEKEAAEESTENTVFVQCSVIELVSELFSDLDTTLEDSDIELKTKSKMDIEVFTEDLGIDSTIIETESSTTKEEEILTESDTNSEAQIEDTEETETLISCLSPEKITYYKKLIIADNLYKTGDKLTAARIYQEEKEAWDRELDPSKILPEANYDPKELSPGGAVYWRIYQEGKQQELESKILTPLELLVAKEPEFIPGHLSYSESLLAYEKEEESLAVLENAISLYPKDVDLLRAKIKADIRTKRWIDASISSRQFALFNPEVPEATEFTRLADEYLEEFKSDVREQLTFNAIGNAVTGAVGFALTGNIFGPISAIDTTVLLLRGESNLGERFAKKVQKQLPMVENEAILNYVREVGNKVAASSGRDEFNYEFYVVMDKNINAFALPGGKIFVNLGVIMNTDSEAELAGLLAHEIAHAVLSHGFQLATRGSLTANVTQYIPYVGGTAGNLIVMNYSRDMERQADIYGTKILVASDYAADGVRNLMAHLQELHEQNEDHIEPPVWLSTHPNTKERVRYMEELIVSNNLNRYAYEGVEKHYQIKQLAKKLWREYQKEQLAKREKEGLY